MHEDVSSFLHASLRHEV